MQGAKPALLPVSRIVPGRNPRTYFDEKAMQELIDSVRANGVLQPILVRPKADVFELVAGERRWRAAKAAGGDDAQIIAIVRDMSDEEADIAALVENVQRESMSPTEEAAGAAKLLGRLKGDRGECAKVLGWSMATLDSRLALMQCSSAVQGALNQRRLKLGHAELLAALPKDKQDKVLERLLSQAKLPEVGELRKSLLSVAKSLTAAIFDKTACTSCPSNSGNQRVLFGEAIEDGHCTNPPCYDGKTDEELQRREASLKDEYPTVRIVRPGDNFTLLKLVAEGPTGVGAEQAKACRSCANFGAAVSAVPEKLGQVSKELCFDPSCNAKKVAERLRQETAETPPTSADSKPAGAGSSQTASKAGKPVAGKAAAASKTAPAVAAVTSAVREFREALWRTALSKSLLAASLEVNRAALVALLIDGTKHDIDADKLDKAYVQLFKDVKMAAEESLEARFARLQAAPAACAKLTHGIVATIVNKTEVRRVVHLLAAIQVDLGKFFELNEAFLKILTKSEIASVAEEVGIRKAMGDAFTKAVGGKKDDLIKAVLSVKDFAYRGALPARLMYKKGEDS